MDISSQRKAKGISHRRFGPLDGRQHSPCAGCQALDWNSIHETDTQAAECPLKGCNICADLPRIDDEIASTLERLSDLVKERQQIIITRPGHDTIIHRMPVEILSMIFMFVKDAIIDFKFIECSEHNFRQPPLKQPSQSPPLLVGAVCKRWRDISLTTPQLWTDIFIDLDKRIDGQVNMIKKWAHRSGALPLDISVFLYCRTKLRKDDEEILLALRILVARWNVIALRVPAFFCYRLLNNLNAAPPINTFFYIKSDEDLKQIKLRHPLRPTRLLCNRVFLREIPCKWDRLVFVSICEIKNDEILHMIRHAQNLRDFIGGTDDNFESGDFPMPKDPIKNCSLTYLATSSNILHRLTLPSLLHLDYEASEDFNVSIDSIVEFMKRSGAPLDRFTYRCAVSPGKDPFPHLGEAREITSLIFNVHDHREDDYPQLDDFFLALSRRPSPDAILPHLRRISFGLCNISMLGSLFRKDSQPVKSKTAMKAPYTKLVSPSAELADLEAAILNSDTFLRLSEAKKSGIDITLVDYGGRDLFHIYDPSL